MYLLVRGLGPNVVYACNLLFEENMSLRHYYQRTRENGDLVMLCRGPKVLDLGHVFIGPRIMDLGHVFKRPRISGLWTYFQLIKSFGS